MSTAKKLLLLFVIIGIADSAYLTAVHYTNLPLYCPEGGVVNCTQVVTSVYSTVAGIPIAIEASSGLLCWGSWCFGFPS